MYGIATPPSIYPFSYPCCKGIKIDIRITKHQNQGRTGWDKSERKRRSKWSQEGHTGGLVTLIIHNLRGRDTVSPQASSERKKRRGSLAPSPSHRQPLLPNMLCKPAIILAIYKHVFVVFLSINNMNTILNAAFFTQQIYFGGYSV